MLLSKIKCQPNNETEVVPFLCHIHCKLLSCRLTFLDCLSERWCNSFLYFMRFSSLLSRATSLMFSSFHFQCLCCHFGEVNASLVSVRRNALKRVLFCHIWRGYLQQNAFCRWSLSLDFSFEVAIIHSLRNLRREEQIYGCRFSQNWRGVLNLVKGKLVTTDLSPSLQKPNFRLFNKLKTNKSQTTQRGFFLIGRYFQYSYYCPVLSFKWIINEYNVVWGEKYTLFEFSCHQKFLSSLTLTENCLFQSDNSRSPFTCLHWNH